MHPSLDTLLSSAGGSLRQPGCGREGIWHEACRAAGAHPLWHVAGVLHKVGPGVGTWLATQGWKGCASRPGARSAKLPVRAHGVPRSHAACFPCSPNKGIRARGHGYLWLNEEATRAQAAGHEAAVKAAVARMTGQRVSAPARNGRLGRQRRQTRTACHGRASAGVQFLAALVAWFAVLWYATRFAAVCIHHAGRTHAQVPVYVAHPSSKRLWAVRVMTTRSSAEEVHAKLL